MTIEITDDIHPPGGPGTAPKSPTASTPVASDAILFEHAVHVLETRFPESADAILSGTLLEEWNAFTGGRPSHVPVQVLIGAIEVLQRRDQAERRSTDAQD